MSDREIDYPALVENALRGVVHDLLVRVAAEGFPGGHHLYLTFSTRHPGVKMAPRLYDLYPEEMTIVLQHQFWDLVVEEELFAVTLHFGGQKQRLTIPFEALASVVDPEAEFGLQLDLAASGDTDGAVELSDSEEEGTGGDVVSLDRFRDRSSARRSDGADDNGD